MSWLLQLSTIINFILLRQFTRRFLHDLEDQRATWAKLGILYFSCQNNILHGHMYTWVFPVSPVLSILLARLTVSPHMSYCGFLAPMTPATMGPWLIPIRSLKSFHDSLLICSSFCLRANENSSRETRCFQSPSFLSSCCGDEWMQAYIYMLYLVNYLIRNKLTFLGCTCTSVQVYMHIQFVSRLVCVYYVCVCYSKCYLPLCMYQ